MTPIVNGRGFAAGDWSTIRRSSDWLALKEGRGAPGDGLLEAQQVTLALEPSRVARE